ncbi:hypothetical protein [Hydrogenivirga sp.]
MIDRDNRLAGFLLVALSLILWAFFFFDFQPISRKATEYLDAGIRTTLASYVLVRGINAGVSVVKESEVSLSPAGVGVSIALGEVLDPLDDITERVSSLMLLSFLSLGAQRLFLELFSGVLLLFTGILSLVSGVMLILGIRWSGLAIRVLLMLLVLRFFLPATGLLNDLVYDTAVRPGVESVNSELSVLGSELRTVVGVRNPEDMSRLLSSLKNGADSAVEKLLTLALYYVFQTLLLPLLSVYVTFKLSLGALRLKL